MKAQWFFHLLVHARGLGRRRCTPWALAALMLVPIAYLQARGLSSLLRHALLVSPLAAAPSRLPSVPTTSHAPQVSAEALLARNPFDSVTGPLNAHDVVLPVPQPVVRDPLDAPRCPKITVRAVTEAPEPRWSFASVEGPGSKHAKLRRVGDTIAEQRVVFIGYNPARLSPAVWLADGHALCQALVFDASRQETQAKAKKKPKRSKKKGGKKRRKSKQGTRLPRALAKKIERVSPTEFRVERSVVDAIISNQATLMRSARLVPERKAGETVGIRLFGIRPKTLLSHLGLKNGDRLEAINGFRMTSPTKALEAYARLRTADHLSIEVTRKGKPLSIEYAIN